MVFLFIVIIILLLIITSKIQIKVENLKYHRRFLEHNSIDSKTNHMNSKYNINIKIIILNILPILWVNINQNKVERLKQNENFKKQFSKNNLIQSQNKLDFKIKKLYLNASIGTESIFLTAMIIPIISTILAILAAQKSKNSKNITYNIKPIYNARKFIKFGIFRYI